MYSTIDAIDKKLNSLIREGKKKFVIYPFGRQGIITKQLLNVKYSIQEEFIIDNSLCDVNPNIVRVEALQDIDCTQYTFLLTSSMNPEIYNSLIKYVNKENIVDYRFLEGETKIGKYCYGPLAFPHRLVAEVGSFCSFALGVDVVGNHMLNAVTTHGFLYSPFFADSFENQDADKGNKYKENMYRKVVIGNDVWLGRNVLITEGVKIGNGVIAGAGAVITKDIPDYAVVGGVPAKIIRYRFTEEQIEKLNKIKWWDWEIEKIKSCYQDFFEIDKFIEKHYIKGEQDGN